MNFFLDNSMLATMAVNHIYNIAGSKTPYKQIISKVTNYHIKFCSTVLYWWLFYLKKVENMTLLFIEFCIKLPVPAGSSRFGCKNYQVHV